MKQISKRTKNIFETIVEKNLFDKVEILVEENKRNLFSEYLLLNYGLKLDKSEQINLKSEKSVKKRSPRNKEIVKGLPYERCIDFKRDRTEELVKKYYSKKYVSEKQKIYDILKTRYIKYKKRKVIDISCLRRIKLIENLIINKELFNV